jgi:hypothetical protein
MAKGYQLIQAQTLTSTAASVTFTNIPQNFTDLNLVISSRSNRAAVQDTFAVVFNDSASGYSYRRVYGDGTNAATDSDSGNGALTTGYTQGGNGTTNVFGSLELYIPNYTSSVNKSVSSQGTSENNATGSSISTVASLWSNTAAISSIKLTPATGATLQIGSTFYLYGVGGTRATGGTITSDGNFTYHTFTSTSTFTALEKIKNAEVLLVAGGGGATGAGSAGGGAGGLIAHTSQSLTAGTSYTVVVGAGGTSGASSDTSTSGSNSQFASLTAVGGGRAPFRANGVSGGSGSGAPAATSTFSAGTGTSGQGNNGGTAVANYTGGGGGGAGAVGGNASTGFSGTGGAGSNTYISWASATSTGVNGYYAGGGGAGGQNVTSATHGLGGIGGGGNGASSNGVNGSSGVANTGGGAGGGWAGSIDTAGGAGGSGLIIVRYPNY